jgi:hypothetical protein
MWHTTTVQCVTAVVGTERAISTFDRSAAFHEIVLQQQCSSCQRPVLEVLVCRYSAIAALHCALVLVLQCCCNGCNTTTSALQCLMEHGASSCCAES